MKDGDKKMRNECNTEKKYQNPTCFGEENDELCLPMYNGYRERGAKDIHVKHFWMPFRVHRICCAI